MSHTHLFGAAKIINDEKTVLAFLISLLCIPQLSDLLKYTGYANMQINKAS